MSAVTKDSLAEEELMEAACNLQKALSKLSQKYLQNIQYPDFNNSHSLQEKTTELEVVLDSFIQARQEFKTANRNLGGKAKLIVQKFFRVSYPFATLLLRIAKDGSAAVFQCKI
jgi:hypothetical protein